MKILIAGDAKGQLNKLFSRTASLHKKAGPFEVLLCTGSFFSDSEECALQWKQYVMGQKQVPIPTLILGPCDASTVDLYKSSGVETSGGELCPNLTYLGSSGVYTTSQGLTIAYLSGVGGAGGGAQQGEHSHYFAKRDVELLISQSKQSGFNGVDVFLTSDWPRGVNKYTQPPPDVDIRTFGAIEFAYLAYHLKPRYHFCGLHNVYYERPPYKNELNGREFTTRFIALANFGNPDKAQKGIYAFNIEPMVAMTKEELGKIPENSTDNPYAEFFGKTDKKKTSSEDSDRQFFFDQSIIDSGKRKRQSQQGTSQGKRSRSGAPSLPKDLPPGVCWFCLANPKVEKHLIIAIGNHSYLALPKGGLVPEHVLILPIGHCASSVLVSQVSCMRLLAITFEGRFVGSISTKPQC
jgi:hypothetical protein